VRDSGESNHRSDESLLKLTKYEHFVSKSRPINVFAFLFQLKAPDKQGENESLISEASDSRPQVGLQRPPPPRCQPAQVPARAAEAQNVESVTFISGRSLSSCESGLKLCEVTLTAPNFGSE
jgi:hypothetical protein